MYAAMDSLMDFLKSDGGFLPMCPALASVVTKLPAVVTVLAIVGGKKCYGWTSTGCQV
jgi:hypothetical protein